jgi:hypothetical protein
MRTGRGGRGGGRQGRGGEGEGGRSRSRSPWEQREAVTASRGWWWCLRPLVRVRDCPSFSYRYYYILFRFYVLVRVCFFLTNCLKMLFVHGIIYFIKMC